MTSSEKQALLEKIADEIGNDLRTFMKENGVKGLHHYVPVVPSVMIHPESFSPILSFRARFGIAA